MEGVCGVIVYRIVAYHQFSSISISITCWMVLPTNCVLCVSRQMVRISSVLYHCNVQ